MTERAAAGRPRVTRRVTAPRDPIFVGRSLDHAIAAVAISWGGMIVLALIAAIVEAL